MRRRRFLKATGGVTAAGLTGLAGCSGQQDPGQSTTETTDAGGNVTTTANSSEWPDLSGQEVHLLWGQPNEEAQNYFRGVASDFEAATGATVNLEFTGIDNLNSRITQLLQSGDPPELAGTNSQFAPTYTTQGILRPVTGVVETNIERYGSMTEGSRIVTEGEDRYVPLWANAQMFYYRDDITETVPDTWDNLLQYVKEADESDQVEYGNYQPAGTGSDDFWHTISFAYTNDARTVERRDGKIVTTIDEGDNRDRWTELLEFFKERYQYSPKTADSSWTAALQSIPEERVAASWYGGARIKNSVEGKPFAENVQLIWPEGRSRTFAGGTDGFVSFEGSNGEAADTFLEFMTQPEQLTPIYWVFSDVHNAPVYPGIADSDAYQEQITELLNSTSWTQENLDYYQKTAIESMQFVGYEVDPPHPYAGTIIGSNSLQNLVSSVLVNDRDMNDAIDNYARELQSILDDAQE